MRKAGETGIIDLSGLKKGAGINFGFTEIPNEVIQSLSEHSKNSTNSGKKMSSESESKSSSIFKAEPTQLWLGNNKLIHIAPSFFEISTSLHTLSLSGNQ